MSELALAWRLARRELRGGLQGFAVFLACLALGVAAIAAVGVTNAGVIDAVKRDAAALLGGDVRLEANNLPIAEDVLAGLMPPEARRSDVVRTNAMAFGRRRSPRRGQPEGGGRRLSALRRGRPRAVARPRPRRWPTAAPWSSRAC